VINDFKNIRKGRLLKRGNESYKTELRVRESNYNSAVLHARLNRFCMITLLAKNPMMNKGKSIKKNKLSSVFFEVQYQIMQDTFRSTGWIVQTNGDEI